MLESKRKALEVAGWKFGDAADFLGMNEEERAELDKRVEMRLREAKLAQNEPVSSDEENI